jgi:hypothetical protein
MLQAIAYEQSGLRECIEAVNMIRKGQVERLAGNWCDGAGEKGYAEKIRGDSNCSYRNSRWGYRGTDGIISTSGDLYNWYQALTAQKILARPTLSQRLCP